MKKGIFLVILIAGIILSAGIAKAVDADWVAPHIDRMDPGMERTDDVRIGFTVEAIKLDNPLEQHTIEGLLEAIVRFLRNIAAPIAAGMIIYGAYQILFAAGDPEKIKTGKRTILYTVIGYAIIWIGWGITSIIREIIG